MTDINDYIVPLDNLDLNKVLSEWHWLTGHDKKIVALTKSGDLLLNGDNDDFYFLDLGNGDLSLIEGKYQDFLSSELPSEIIDEILFTSVVDELVSSGLILKPNQVYSYTTLPILGGKYDSQNMYPLDLYEYYTLMGEIHFKLKDLPDGTNVKIVVTG